MSVSRSESQTPHLRGRRRSNTAQSLFKNPPQSATPLLVGDFKVLTTWVHDPKESTAITLNQSFWPGLTEGDLLQLSAPNAEQSSGFLFIVPRDEGVAKQQLQISVPRPVAEKFGLKNNGEVHLTKVDPEKWGADLIELVFQDQYLGRSEMWRLNSHLVGQCAYTHEEISFIGVIVAQVQAIYIGGKKVSTAHITSRTKLVYRSLSAKATIFIQVCRELWDFAGDGERYNEKIVHSFLPALLSKWRDAGTTHIVTIVLISRVYYDESEIEAAAGPLRLDDDRMWYKDFFKVITDLEVVHDWKPTLFKLKDTFWAFQRDILLAHHHHRATLNGPQPKPEYVKLIGRLSFAHEGPILEALNLGFHPTETHYIDRSLSLTGSSTIIITPGTGYFRVSKKLLRLTTTRMLDQGFAVDLVSLAKPPLHQSPIFAFQGIEPELKPDFAGKVGIRALDPLWGGDDGSGDSAIREKTTFWWEPFWLSVSFWDRQMDLPFRDDRFIARAKMPEIEMLGLLDHDVLSSIELPFLPDLRDPSSTPVPDGEGNDTLLRREADKFDADVFAIRQDAKPPAMARNSMASSGSGSMLSASFRSADNMKKNAPSRVIEVSRVPPIQESPRRVIVDLPVSEGSNFAEQLSVADVSGLSTSPSQSSMRSVRSSVSTASRAASTSTASPSRPPNTKSRFTPAWLFNTFTRSGLSQPQTSPVSASGHTTPGEGSDDTSSSTKTTARTTTSATLTPQIAIPKVQAPKPMAIKAKALGRTGSGRNWDDDLPNPHRGSLTRHSPVGTPPRDEPAFAKRWSGNLSGGLSMGSPLILVNPSKPLNNVPYTASSLARRWQHIFAKPLSKHEIKWKSMITPACLPLTVEYFPPSSELETSYDVFSYDFAVDPPEMRRSFLIKPPAITGNPGSEAVRRAWAMVVMRGMAALRLAQGFQFVLRPTNLPGLPDPEPTSSMRRSTSYVTDDTMDPKPAGAAEVLQSPYDPIYLSMSNEIHRISYSQDSIQVRRYVRRMPRSQPFDYKCLIWPKLGVGYTELVTSFVSHGLEDYRWNSLDMLVAGYENQSNESLRYWRTRFVVIPTDEVPQSNVSPAGEKLDEEEIRLMGMDKLAELFSKLRWLLPEDKGKAIPPVRFLTTDLGPIPSVLDESLVSQLDDIHAAGPLKKKMKSERDVADMSIPAIAKAMREEDGVPIKEHRWHGIKYPNTFVGADLVSWLVREFRDVSTREQATEWGSKLQEQGLFDHCRGAHGFLDGYYFYALRGEYIVPMTPRGGWFGVRTGRLVSGDETSNRAAITSSPVARASLSGRKAKKRLIMSQSMVIDIDPNKRSDQSEWVILHHDIIHNPATCFHFEFQWIGTTARCIDDLLRQWSRTIERYGLKLVESYVSQISDIRDRNPFQSCFPIPLALPPPAVADMDPTVAESITTTHFFESAILKKFGFVLDIEATDLYPAQVEVIYSYRRSAFAYSQWVHRSGVAFVQVMGGAEGFLFLTNRLMAPGKIGSSLKAQRPATAAEEIRVKLHAFCQDVPALRLFYNDELAQLHQQVSVLEEPPPLDL
ncbi:vacuolar membrane-associated protein iml1 [Steccherinum ochraceum]|uniref:Vacuolar membrane-associated protein IML1 n=1 Tax=Steccherinum ochraceum TaxID=92696 RepID=A0A4R0RNL5_9APHY|nr:vacuolar membrane-associated protein iml1 [Steccherinum ochraceum]